MVRVPRIMRKQPQQQPVASIEDPSKTLTASALLDGIDGGPNAPCHERPVSEQQAMRVSTVYACASLIAETIATLPINVVQDVGGRAVTAPDHPVHQMIRRHPNSWQTAFEFWSELLFSVLIRGDGLAEIKWRRNGMGLELWPIHPDQLISVSWVNGRLKYRVRRRDGTAVTLDQEFVLHVPSFWKDGYRGMSLIRAYGRGAINLSREAEGFSSTHFQNAARPSGVVEYPHEGTPQMLNNVKSAFADNYQGQHNAGKVMVLDAGLTFKAISVTPEDSQMLESRKFQVEEIARIFRVPLHMIGSTEKSTSWGSGLTEQTNGFLKYTLRPWLVRVEQELDAKLLTDDFHARWNAEGLLRGVPKERSEFYSKVVPNGVMTQNEARALEDLPPLPGGDRLLTPQNLAAQADDNEEEDQSDDAGATA